MNPFSGLSPTDTSAGEIDSDTQLRKSKKKLRNLETKPPSPENRAKIKRLQVEIDEYEHRRIPALPKKGPTRTQTQTQTQRERERLEREKYERARKQREQREREKYERAREQREQREQREREKYERARKRDRYEREQRNKEQVERPEDILALERDFTEKEYRKLAKKYHPDKGGDVGDFQILESIREQFRGEREFEPDETWCKM